jgi:endonuclease/exonuclease/phosphatase family metal-dependent hydrolase
MLRVATYNIRHCRGLDGIVDVGRIARTIIASGAGLVALQEVDRNRTRSGSVDQPGMLGELTGLGVSFCPTVIRGAEEYGVALAADDQLAVDIHRLPRRAREEPRVALVTRWRGLAVVAVHLATQKPARGLQIEAIARIANSLAPPVIVLGDLNASPPELGSLVRAGFSIGPPVRSRAKRTRPQIDYVMPGPGVSAARVWSLEVAGSDHLPVVAGLDLHKPSGGNPPTRMSF